MEATNKNRETLSNEPNIKINLPDYVYLTYPVYLINKFSCVK